MVVFCFGLSTGCGGDVESRMAEVRALQGVGQFVASIDELREILVIEPDLPEASYRLGVALVQTGEQSRAVWSLQKASESSEYAVPAGSLLAGIHLESQDFDEALRTIDRVLEIEPERGAALRLRAKANIGAKNFEAALADTRRLIELFPDDYQSNALHAVTLLDAGELEESQAAHERLKTLGAQTGDPELEARGCLAPAVFAEEQLEDSAKASEYYEECLAKYASSRLVIDRVTKFFDESGRADRSTAIFRSTIEESPENLQLRASLAARLQSRGKSAEAEAVLVEATKAFGSAQAWSLLTRHYKETGQPQKAIEAIDKVIEVAGAAGDPLLFEKADLLVDLGELDRADALAEEIGEPTYATLIRGRISYERGDAIGALKAFDRGISRWPGNAAARYLAGLAARQLGDFDRAITEFREAIRVDRGRTDAALVLARIYFDRGEFDKALTFTASYIADRPSLRHGEAQIIATRALAKQKKWQSARKAIGKLAAMPNRELDVVVETALIDRAQHGPAASMKGLEKSGVDFNTEENEEALRMLADSLLALGQQGEALERVNSALVRRPDAASLYKLQGTVLWQMDRRDDARNALVKAIALNSEHAASYGALATLNAIEGRSAEAIAQFDRASELDPDNVEYAYSAATLSLASGETDAAERRLREVVRRSVGHTGARNDLAWILAEKGAELDLAVALSKDATRQDPSANNFDTLGWVHLKRGEVNSAVSAFERAAGIEPDSPSIRYHLALALGEAGDDARAKEMFQAALDAGAFPEFEEARRKLEEYGQL